MFARNVAMHLKANSLPEFEKTFDDQVLPLLQKQAGFKDEITFAMQGGNDVVATAFGIPRNTRKLITLRRIPRCSRVWTSYLMELQRSGSRM
jgi:hypothetical protein